MEFSNYSTSRNDAYSKQAFIKSTQLNVIARDISSKLFLGGTAGLKNNRFSPLEAEIIKAAYNVIGEFIKDESITFFGTAMVSKELKKIEAIRKSTKINHIIVAVAKYYVEAGVLSYYEYNNKTYYDVVARKRKLVRVNSVKS